MKVGSGRTTKQALNYWNLHMKIMWVMFLFSACSVCVEPEDELGAGWYLEFCGLGLIQADATK